MDIDTVSMEVAPPVYVSPFCPLTQALSMMLFQIAQDEDAYACRGDAVTTLAAPTLY
jgi:hypothetical protein